MLLRRNENENVDNCWKLEARSFSGQTVTTFLEGT